MITAFDATLALMVLADPRHAARVRRIRATLAWLRASGEADGARR